MERYFKKGMKVVVFQFLIGKVQRYEKEYENGICSWFQFLIGKVQLYIEKSLRRDCV